MKLYLPLIICLLSFSFYAQENKYEISAPIDLNEAGWNRVLCMKNGNTLLFHFEKGKRIIVKVFDSTRKEIAGSKDHYKILDFLITDFALKGIYDINDEAVLFFDQDLNSKHSLVRLRYNAHTGKLIEEIIIAESRSEDKRIRFYVMKNKDNENYEILFCTDKHHPKESDIYIVFFDNKHKSKKEIQLPVDRKKYDDLVIVDAESQPNGVLITAALKKTLIYAPAGSNGPIQEQSSTDDHFLQFFYIPMDSKNARTTMVNLSTGVFPHRAYYTYNPFAQTLNLLLFSYRSLYYRFGQNIQTGNVSRTLFFKIDEQDMASSIGLNEIKNTMANSFLKKQTDTTCFFNGAPIKMFTNENGLTTILSETFNDYKQQETMNSVSYEIYLKQIGITQVDDNGNEIWGTVLPLSQYFNSYRSYPRHSRQFMSFKAYCKDRNFYIIYNDYDKNFNNSLALPGDTVFSFSNTNACYYKMDRKKEITKHYLLGTPSANEYKCSFIQGAYFDEQRGVYATLVEYRKNNDVTFRMAWSHLE